MILEKTIPLALLFLLAILLRHKSILTTHDAKTIGKILINLVVPALVFKIVVGIQLKAEYVLLPIAAICINIAFLFIAYTYTKLKKVSSQRMGSILTLFPSLEGGTVGYILMLAAFGEFGLSQMVFFDLGNGIFLFTALYFIAGLFNPNSKGPLHSLKQFIKTPMLWAIALGFICNSFSWNPPILENLTTSISGATTFLVMMMLGLECKLNKATFPIALRFTLVKLGVGLVLAWCAVALFKFEGMQKTCIYMSATLPSSVVALLFAEEHQLDIEYSASVLSVALPLSFIYYPVALYFLGF